MKKYIFTLIMIAISLNVCASTSVTFCYWTVSAITEAKDKEGNVEYSVNYKGKTYVLNWDQYCDLMEGKDITLKID